MTEITMHTARSCCAGVALGTALFVADPGAAANIETAAPLTFEYGAHAKPDGWVDFGFRAPSADAVELLIYDAPDATTPANAGQMTRDAPGDWSTRISGPSVGVGTLCMYRATGVWDGRGRAFGTVLSENFVLNDPYVYWTNEAGYLNTFRRPVRRQRSANLCRRRQSIVYDHVPIPPRVIPKFAQGPHRL
jgi:hypothetical protein